jgi:hypothetical protein
MNERKRIIGQAFGLPSELADRLIGETDEALVADAKLLARGVKDRSSAGRRDLNTLPVGNPALTSPLTLDDISGMTLAEVVKRLPEIRIALEAQHKR